MRLIDADKFQRDLTSVWKWLVERDTAGYGTTHGEMLDKVHDILSTQPTAYDIDKVVEELEEIINPKYFYFCRVSKGKCNHFNDDIDCLDCAILKAIEIVKDGEEE